MGFGIKPLELGSLGFGIWYKTLRAWKLGSLEAWKLGIWDKTLGAWELGIWYKTLGAMFFSIKTFLKKTRLLTRHLTNVIVSTTAELTCNTSAKLYITHNRHILKF